MKTRINSEISPKKAKRLSKQRQNAAKTLGVKAVLDLSAEVTGDTQSERRTSRGKATKSKTYMRPMSAIDVAEKKNCRFDSYERPSGRARP